MSEKRIFIFIISLIVLGLLALAICYGLRYVSFFNIDRISVQGMARIPAGVETLLASCYGINRFALKRGELEAKIEKSPLVDDCLISFDFPAHMVVTLVPSAEECLLFDGVDYYLLQDGMPAKLEEADWRNVEETLCTVELSPSFIAYLQTYSSPSSFLEMLALISDVNADNRALITRIKYDNNTANGFGQIVLTLGSLHCELYVRDRVSKDRISDSIRVIQASVEGDPAGRINFHPVHWDLYSDALVRRRVE